MQSVKSKIQGIKVQKVVDPGSTFHPQMMNDLNYASRIVEKYLGKKNHLKKYLGKGTVGYAYLTKDNTVYKITEATEEAAASLILSMFSDKLETQAKIYRIYEIVIGNNKLFIIEKEFAQPVKKYLEKELNLQPYDTYKPADVLEHLLEEEYDSYDSFELHALARARKEDEQTKEQIEDLLHHNKKFMQSVYEFHRNLTKNEQESGLPLADIHIGNIGVKNDTVKCFDCITSSKYILKDGGLVPDINTLRNIYKRFYDEPNNFHIGEANGKPILYTSDGSEVHQPIDIELNILSKLKNDAIVNKLHGVKVEDAFKNILEEIKKTAVWENMPEVEITNRDEDSDMLFTKYSRNEEKKAKEAAAYLSQKYGREFKAVFEGKRDSMWHIYGHLKNGGNMKPIKSTLKKAGIKSRLSEMPPELHGKLGWRKFSDIAWEKKIEDKYEVYIKQNNSEFDLFIFKPGNEDLLDGGTFNSFEEAENWFAENYMQEKKEYGGKVNMEVLSRELKELKQKHPNAEVSYSFAKTQDGKGYVFKIKEKKEYGGRTETIGTFQWTDATIEDANEFFKAIKAEPLGKDYVEYIYDVAKESGVPVNKKAAQEYYKNWLLEKEQTMKMGGRFYEQGGKTFMSFEEFKNNRPKSVSGLLWSDNKMIDRTFYYGYNKYTDRIGWYNRIKSKTITDEAAYKLYVMAVKPELQEIEMADGGKFEEQIQEIECPNCEQISKYKVFIPESGDHTQLFTCPKCKQKFQATSFAPFKSDDEFSNLPEIELDYKTEDLVEKALKWVKKEYSEAYIQGQMYASRDSETSIEDIAEAIRLAKLRLKKDGGKFTAKDWENLPKISFGESSKYKNLTDDELEEKIDMADSDMEINEIKLEQADRIFERKFFVPGATVIAKKTVHYFMGQAPKTDKIGRGEKVTIEKVDSKGNLQFEEHPERYGPYEPENFTLENRKAVYGAVKLIDKYREKSKDELSAEDFVKSIAAFANIQNGASPQSIIEQYISINSLMEDPESGGLTSEQIEREAKHFLKTYKKKEDGGKSSATVAPRMADGGMVTKDNVNETFDYMIKKFTRKDVENKIEEIKKAFPGILSAEKNFLSGFAISQLTIKSGEGEALTELEHKLAKHWGFEPYIPSLPMQQGGKVNTEYTRVVPRDLFNESKLLKCIGRLILLIHDNNAPVPMSFHHDGEPFNIGLLEEGSLTITNINIWIKKKQFLFKTIYNSKSNYPLFVQDNNYTDYRVFDEKGEFDSEFLEFCKTVKEDGGKMENGEKKRIKNDFEYKDGGNISNRVKAIKTPEDLEKFIDSVLTDLQTFKIDKDQAKILFSEMAVHVYNECKEEISNAGMMGDN